MHAGSTTQRPRPATEAAGRGARGGQRTQGARNIRNWKELTFYRPSKTTEYVHIDALFGEPGKHVVDFDLIESQFRHLMRVAVSVR